MKKFIIMLLACALVLSCVGAFAAAPATPWNDDSVKVKITNSVTGEDVVYDQSAMFAPGFNWSGKLDWSLKNNQLVAVKKADATEGFETVLAQTFANFTTQDNGADGYGFYIKNNCADDILFSFEGSWIAPTNDSGNTLADSGITFTPDSEAVLTSMDGVQSVIKAEGVMPHNDTAAFEIPKGFEGYITIPTASIQLIIGEGNDYSDLDGQPMDNTKITISWPAFNLNNVDENGVVFDNFFVYGSKITASEDASVVTDAITLKQGGDSDKDDDKETGDLSVLAYAAAAAAGCGALIFRRKK